MTTDYIVFAIGSSMYALDVANVERIIQIPKVTPVVNAHPFVDGMIVYQNKTAKILNFRKASGMRSQEEELEEVFEQVKTDHKNWIESLARSLEEESEFKQAIDPHTCRLGEWLDGYTSHDPEVIAMLQALVPVHVRLHETGKEMLVLRHNDPQGAVAMLQTHIAPVYAQMIRYIDEMIRRSEEFSRYQQKLVIYHDGDESIAIKVDGIDDIALLDDAAIKQYDHAQVIGGCLRTRGVVEHKGKLVIVVESISLPHEEVK